MKKIGFMVQVITLIIALPLLTVMEVNHVKGVSAKKTAKYASAPVAKNAAFLSSTGVLRLPS